MDMDYDWEYFGSAFVCVLSMICSSLHALKEYTVYKESSVARQMFKTYHTSTFLNLLESLSIF